MLELHRFRPDHPDALTLIDQVQRYYVELYGGPDTDPLVPQEFAPPHGGFWLGYVDGEAVAMGGWTAVPDREVPAAKIRRMYVSSAVRRHGYAAQLLGALEDDARTAGVVEMVLTTGRPQRDAIAFYRSTGYDDVPPFGYYADVPTAVHLGKRLPARPPEVSARGR